MTNLENNLNKIKDKISTCTILTNDILGIQMEPEPEIDITTCKLYEWRDHHSGDISFTSRVIDTEVAQSKLKNGYTIVARIYPTDYSNYRGLFGRFYNGGTDDTKYGIIGLQYSTDGNTEGELTFGNFPGGYSTRACIPVSYIPENNWHIVVASYDGNNTGRVYVGASLIHENTTFYPLIPYQNIVIGISMTMDAKRYFYGTISDFKIYNKALSVAEIEAVIAEINQQI